MENALAEIDSKPASQQPDWDDAALVRRVREELAARRALVRAQDTRTLRALLARVAVGDALVVQAGDCAEDPAECRAGDVARKVAVLDLLAGALKMGARKPVIRAARVAGQFAKPRSKPTERVGGVELPVYRGHMVNGPEPDVETRRPNPLRLLTGYMAASEAMSHLGWQGPAGRAPVEPPVWTSHEALLLDYETPMLRRDEEGRLFLASTHWPWIGERTRDLDDAHAALLAEVINPVACKVGPRATVDELVSLCDILDPGRTLGRLTLIARVGADAVAERLPPLVEGVRAAGHSVIWLCDPMHANTVTTASGLKTRFVRTMAREVREFRVAVERAGGVAGGLHLETTPDEVTECVDDESEVHRLGDRYATLCDPRLNPEQAMALVSAWSG